MLTCQWVLIDRKHAAQVAGYEAMAAEDAASDSIVAMGLCRARSGSAEGTYIYIYEFGSVGEPLLFFRFRFRFRLLKSYGSGSGSNF